MVFESFAISQMTKPHFSLKTAHKEEIIGLERVSVVELGGGKKTEPICNLVVLSTVGT